MISYVYDDIIWNGSNFSIQPHRRFPRGHSSTEARFVSDRLYVSMSMWFSFFFPKHIVPESVCPCRRRATAVSASDTPMMTIIIVRRQRWRFGFDVGFRPRPIRPVITKKPRKVSVSITTILFACAASRDIVSTLYGCRTILRAGRRQFGCN